MLNTKLDVLKGVTGMIEYRHGAETRTDVMMDRATGVAFNLDEKDRQKFNYQLRKALQTLIQVDAAYEGHANRERCDKAVEIVIDRRRNTARGTITWLESRGYVTFKRNASGSCVEIPEMTKISMNLLKKLKKRINKVALAEEGDLEGVDVTEDRKLLEEYKVYVSLSEDEINAKIKAKIERAIAKDKALAAASKKEAEDA